MWSGWGGEAVVLLVIMRKEVGDSVSGLSKKDGWLWEGGGENTVVGPREQSKCWGEGGPRSRSRAKGLVGGGSGTLSPGMGTQGAGAQAGSGLVSRTTPLLSTRGTPCVLGLGTA